MMYGSDFDKILVPLRGYDCLTFKNYFCHTWSKINGYQNKTS